MAHLARFSIATACVVTLGVLPLAVPSATAADPTTATIQVADSTLTIGETSLVTITFSQPVTGFTLADLTPGNGSLSGLTTSDNISYTATLTPSAGITDPTNVITLDNAGVSVPGTGTTDSDNYAVDTVAPSATVVVAATELRAGETSLVTITFTEAVTGLALDDLSVASGDASDLSTSDGGITWTATLTPRPGTSDATNLLIFATSGVADLAGNPGSTMAVSNNYAVATRRPAATIVVADAALAAGETSQVTFTFTEAVSGFDNADVTVTNGTLSAVGSTDGGTTWTATLTPTAGGTDLTNAITLDNTGFSNVLANTGVGTSASNNYAVDTRRPTATITLADHTLTAGETSLATITFSEAVTGLTPADLTVASGTISALATADGGTTWTGTLTPTPQVSAPSNLITLDNTGIADLAGNAGSGSTDSASYAVSTVRPTAAVVVADTHLSPGETSLVTITFASAVSGFDLADLTVENGTLSPLSSTDGGVTWTTTLTPAAGLTDATNVISLDGTGVVNAAGNVGLGTTSSNNYAIATVPVIPPDTTAPHSHASGPERTNAATWEITYTVDPDASPITTVDLYATAPGQSAATKVATDTTAQDGRFTYSGTADGTYTFHTIATDAAGNTETTPASPDVTTQLDTRAPGIASLTRPRPARLDLSRGDAVRLRFRVDEDVTSQVKILRAGQVVRAFRPTTTPAGRIEQSWRGVDLRGRKVAPGRHRVVLLAQDQAGNRSRTVTTLRVVR